MTAHVASCCVQRKMASMVWFRCVLLARFWISVAPRENGEAGNWVGAGVIEARGDDDCLDGRVTGKVIVDEVGERRGWRG